MKIYTNGSFIRLRERFKNAEEIGSVINRSRACVMNRLKDGFTENEERLILAYLGLSDTKENRKEIFGR